jgi:hypothetical protein
MQIKIGNYLIFIIFAATAIGLFVIKNKVEALSYSLAQISKQIADERSKIHLLKAEISYLTSPAMLKQFVNNNLNMQIVSLDQVIPDPLTQKAEGAGRVVAVARIGGNTQVKWRFKKSPNRYLQQTAMQK